MSTLLLARGAHRGGEWPHVLGGGGSHQSANWQRGNATESGACLPNPCYRRHGLFVTKSAKVENARAMVEEEIYSFAIRLIAPFAIRPASVLCKIYQFEHGVKSRRADLKLLLRVVAMWVNTVTLFVDRCVMCTRCVRFTREIAGTSEIDGR